MFIHFILNPSLPQALKISDTITKPDPRDNYITVCVLSELAELYHQLGKVLLKQTLISHFELTLADTVTLHIHKNWALLNFSSTIRATFSACKIILSCNLD